MSMSSHVVGIIPADSKFKEYKLIYDSCLKNNIAIPKEVEEFFNDEPPDEKGVLIDLEVTNWSSESSEGFELDVNSIPKDVKIIRFFNSY